MKKVTALLNNKAFRAGASLCTLGVGSFLFFKDFRKWLNDSTQPTSNTNHLTRLLVTGAFCDNGFGMVWSRFAGGDKNAWKDHFIATSIQVPLLVF